MFVFKQAVVHKYRHKDHLPKIKMLVKQALNIPKASLTF